MLFPCLKPCLEGPPANPAQTSTKNNLKKSLQVNIVFTNRQIVFKEINKKRNYMFLL